MQILHPAWVRMQDVTWLAISDGEFQTVVDDICFVLSVSVPGLYSFVGHLSCFWPFVIDVFFGTLTAYL